MFKDRSSRAQRADRSYTTALLALAAHLRSASLSSADVSVLIFSQLAWPHLAPMTAKSAQCWAN